MHFTYTASADPYSLQQGDVLGRTPELDALLASAFPRFHGDPANRYFLVLTQSCDLVLRQGRCKSRYISIAAVRALDEVVQTEIGRFQRDPIERALGLCNNRYYDQLLELMERLLNNNETRYFYLRRDAYAGLDVDHCAHLQLSIPLVAAGNYNILLGAKIAQLSEPFQHKLGYLIGHMFGRIGTEDWVPEHVTLEEFEKLKREPIQGAAGWVPADVHAKVLKQIKALPPDQQTIQRAETVIEDLARQREGRLSEVLDEVGAVLGGLGVATATVERVRRHLKNHASFTARIK